MIIKKIVCYGLLLLLACSPDYGVHTEIIEVVASPPTDIVVDSFIQPTPPEKLDVLLIVDTSGSMNDNYEQLSRGVEILRGDIELLTTDYKIGFINSSLSVVSGVYFAGPYDVFSTSIDFLLAPWSLGEDYHEAGFAAMYTFVTATEEGATFFRDDSDKLIIFVSDEDEQSSITADVFRTWLFSHFQYNQHDIVAIVTVENNVCPNPYTWAVGYKYIELITYYGKTPVDICAEWEEWLGESTFLAGEVQHINLSRIPVEESLIVYLNGIETPLWYYLDSTNTVYLDFLPAQGDLVEVAYVAYTE